jgi:hypothetical protein
MEQPQAEPVKANESRWKKYRVTRLDEKNIVIHCQA